MAIFISANAVEYGLRCVSVPHDLSVAAIGHATAAALQHAGYRNILVPAQGADSEALLAAPALHEVAELHIGHALVGHAVFVGLRQAISDFKAEAIRARRVPMV